MKSARPCPTFSISRSSNNTSERQAAEVQVLHLGKIMETNWRMENQHHHWMTSTSASLVASNVNRKARQSVETTVLRSLLHRIHERVRIQNLHQAPIKQNAGSSSAARHSGSELHRSTIYQKKLIIKIQTSNYAELNQNMYTVEHIITASSATMVSPGSSHRGSQALQRRAVRWALDPFCCNHRYKRSDF